MKLSIFMRFSSHFNIILFNFNKNFCKFYKPIFLGSFVVDLLIQSEVVYKILFEHDFNC